MERFLAAELDAKGGPLTGVSITVKDVVTGSNASLWSDDGITTKANPFSNDANGSYEFYARNGRYHVERSKAGGTFVAADSQDILLWDPRDERDYVRLYSEFLADFLSGTTLVIGEMILAISSGQVAALQTTLKGGVLRIAEAGGVAGRATMADRGGNQITPYVITADPLVLEMGIEKVGDAVAGTRRVGLADNTLSADPTNGVFVRQVDTNNAFAVSRASSIESTLDLGQTLNSRSRVRLLMKTGEIRVILDGVNKGTITSNIPSAALGWALHGGSITGGGGLDIDYLDVWMKR